jgi:hypothetical protein
MKDGEEPTFYMVSFLLDLMCTRNIFHRPKSELACCRDPCPCIIQCAMGNRYKKSYSLICDEFITRIYFILFKKEFPRILAIANKMISKVGHWYLDEHATYIKVFDATGAPHILPSHVSYRLVVGEICYETILQGYNATLVKDNK